MNIVLKGRIIPTQNTVGNVLTVPKSVDGNINSQKQIGGIVSTQTQRLSGTVKNPSHVHGIINKPSHQTPTIEGDHKFITVDLVKFNTRLDNVPSVCAIVPFSSAISQTNTGKILIDLSPSAVSVSQVTALTDTEVYDNVNP